MSTAEVCPACGGPQVDDPASTPRVALRCCTGCRHRTARHAATTGVARDYHAQYDQEGFLAALRTTRERQARAILALLRSHDDDVGALLDFGCGRGWFLRQARQAGFARLAGADASEMAVELQRQAGFEVLRVPGEDPGALDVHALSFRPEVLTLLDVIEHFPPPRVVPVLAALVSTLAPALRWVIVKVPVSSGLLYRTASALARAGVRGPLEQLYQAGTVPPHLGYFTERSLRAVLDRSGLELVAVQRDRDFEAETFPDRVAALRRAPRAGRVAGSALALLAAATGWEDSVVALARPGSAR